VNELTTFRGWLCNFVMVIKFLPGIPCVIWGLCIGVIGFGPEGLVPIGWRLAGLCFFIGGASVCYPFSYFSRRGPINWLIVGCASFPALSWIIAVIKNPKYMMPPDDAMLGAIVLLTIIFLFPLLSLTELLLSGKHKSLS
jgi:hypothetical protein